MKLLAFEGRYVLESTDCPRCGGKELYDHPSPRSTPECWNCRGLGRKPSALALQLFYDICAMLGKPMTQALREGRLEPKHLLTIWGKELVPGMKVAMVTSGAQRDWPEVIERIEDLPLEQRRLHFTDGSARVVSAYAYLHRELTPKEIDRVQAFMAQRVGKGVVEAGS